MNNWLVKGKPGQRNDFDELLRRTEPDMWETKKVIPADFTAGDRIFLYESSPSKRLIALASVADPRSGYDGPFNQFTIKYETRRFKKTLHQDEIRNMPGLEDPSFLKSGNAGTIYRLSPEQAGLLHQAIVERNSYLDTSPSVTGSDNVEEKMPFVDQEAFFGVPEGNPLLRIHLIYERAPGLASQKKASVKDAKQTLSCEVCDFDFFYRFGERGADFCEVHHRLPLSKNPPRVTTMADLAIVCSNCHRMLHRQPEITVEKLREAISDTRPTMHYKGYEGLVLYNSYDKVLHGTLLGTQGIQSYEGSSIIEIASSFHEAVEEYILDSNQRTNASKTT